MIRGIQLLLVWSFIGRSDWLPSVGSLRRSVLFRTTLRNDVARDTCIFYLSWLAATFGVLLASPAYDTRYLWFVYPAIVAVAATALHSVLAQYSDLRKANLAVLAIATVFCVWNLRTEPVRVTGPAAAAALTGTGGRYCTAELPTAASSSP